MMVMKWIGNNKKEVASVQLSTVNERISVGNKLFAAAWIFEIVAATIGLYVAWTTGNNIAALEGDVSQAQQAQIILGSLPFVMVALAEVLKIPIVYLVYINRNLITKFIFSIVLFGLTLITFETLAAAFENQFTNITHKVKETEREIVDTTNSILELKSKIKETEAQTLESLNDKYNKNINSLNKTYDEKIKNLKSQIITVEQALEKAPTNKVDLLHSQITEFKKVKSSKILLLREDYQQEKNSRSSKLSAFQKDRNEGIKTIDDQLEKLNKVISDHNERADNKWNVPYCKKDNNCKKNYVLIDNFNNDKDKLLKSSQEKNDEDQYFKKHMTEKDQIEVEYQVKIDELSVQIDSVNEAILNKKTNSLQIKNIVNNLERIRAKHKGNIDFSENNHKATIELFNLNKDKIGEWSSQIESKDQLIKKLNEESDEHEEFTQIYRVTKHFNGYESLSQVTPNDVAITAFWWYGSLAALVSIMGVVLAFGALILRHPKERYKELKKEKRHRLKNTIRRVFISLRKRIRRPKVITKIKFKEVIKEVIKEVPVQKVVLTEVPVEVIKKEVFYEPLYTKDPDLLKFGTAKVRDILNKFGKDKTVKKDDKGS